MISWIICSSTRSESWFLHKHMFLWQDQTLLSTFCPLETDAWGVLTTWWKSAAETPDYIKRRVAEQSFPGSGLGLARSRARHGRSLPPLEEGVPITYCTSAAASSLSRLLIYRVLLFPVIMLVVILLLIQESLFVEQYYTRFEWNFHPISLFSIIQLFYLFITSVYSLTYWILQRSFRINEVLLILNLLDNILWYFMVITAADMLLSQPHCIRQRCSADASLYFLCSWLQT